MEIEPKKKKKLNMDHLPIVATGFKNIATKPPLIDL